MKTSQCIQDVMKTSQCIEDVSIAWLFALNSIVLPDCSFYCSYTSFRVLITTFMAMGDYITLGALLLTRR